MRPIYTFVIVLVWWFLVLGITLSAKQAAEVAQSFCLTSACSAEPTILAYDFWFAVLFISTLALGHTVLDIIRDRHKKNMESKGSLRKD